MSSQSETIPQIHVMSSTTKSKTKARREPRDTGFPEPFNEGMFKVLVLSTFAY